MMTSLEIVRLIGSEFKEIDNTTILKWIEIVAPMVSKKQFGRLYEQAIAYLVCHKLKMSGKGETPLGELGAIGLGLTVGSVSEGGSSISFGANASSMLVTDAELGLTVYGAQYLSLRRMVVIPIHCGAEGG